MSMNNHHTVVVDGIKMVVVTAGNQTVDDVLSQLDKDEEPSYITQRVMAYPSIQEQLDMMYKDMINGGTCWVDCISEIKSKFPKT